MLLEIEGKQLEVKFTLGAIAALDQAYKANVNGIEFGIGIQQVLAYLEQRNPLAVFNVLLAVQRDDAKIGKFSLEKWLETQDIEKLCVDLISEIKKQPLTKAMARSMEEQTAELA